MALWFYHATTEQLQRRGLDLPTLPPLEQDLRARECLGSLAASAPRQRKLLDYLYPRDDSVDKASAQLIELLQAHGVWALVRGGRGMLPGPLAPFVGRLIELVLEPVPHGKRRHVFSKLDAYARANLWPDEGCLMLEDLAEHFHKAGGW